MPVGYLIGLMGFLAVVAVYFWLVKKPADANSEARAQ
jgi:hypothetical protein